jgi:predicted SAM-dependent methyltransferase
MDDNSVDIIFLHHVVEHLWEIRPALTEAKRVLRQGGHVVIATPNLDSANRRKWGRWWRGYEAPRHLRLYTLSAMQDVLRDTGFGSIWPAAPPVRRQLGTGKRPRKRY